MKIIILAVMLMATQVKAQTAVQFIKDAASNAEGDSAFNLAGKQQGAIYVPLRTIDLPVANALDAGGGALVGSGSPQGLISARLNIPQLINGLFGTSWFTKYSHGISLPTLFIGPALKAEWPIDKWTWKMDTYLLIGIPFGSVFNK